MDGEYLRLEWSRNHGDNMGRLDEIYRGVRDQLVIICVSTCWASAQVVGEADDSE